MLKEGLINVLIIDSEILVLTFNTDLCY